MRKLILIFCFLLNGCFQASSQCVQDVKSKPVFPYQTNVIDVPMGWKILESQSDEFSGFTLDYNKWGVYNNFWHPMSQQAGFMNSTDNVEIQNGKLLLKAKSESTPIQCTNWIGQQSFNYSSGYIYSLFEAKYGYLEVKVYVPDNIALEPCFWTVWNDQINEIYGEIDVYEAIGTHDMSRTYQQNYHKNLIYSNSESLYQVVQLDDVFIGKENVFAVEWLPEELNFYLNGRITSSVRYTNLSYIVGPSTGFTCVDFSYGIKQQIQLSLSLSNLVSTYPNLSEHFEVDYYRTYKLQEGFNYQYWPNSFSILDADLFKVNKSLKLGGDINHTAIIPSGENITVWAKESIILDKGFTLNPNTIFNARVIKTDGELFNN